MRPSPGTWSGAAHVFGVEEAAMLSLPDLPELMAGAPEPIPDLPAPPPPPEQFKPCAPPAPDFVPDRRGSRPAVAAPRLERAGYGDWGSAIRFALDLLSPTRTVAQRRDVMLVASLPLPSRRPGSVPHGAEGWPLAVLDDASMPGGALLTRARIGSARLQLAYPWIETDDSRLLPEGVQAPEGVLAGALARTALRKGAFRSAADTRLATVRRALPELGTGALRRGLPGAADWLGDRLSLIGAVPEGFAMVSDATMSADLAWRAGGLSRLMGILLRAARQLGQQRLFENSGPALWAALRDELEVFLQRLRSAGALAGSDSGRGVHGPLRSRHHDAGRHRRRAGHRDRVDHRRPTDPPHHRHACPRAGWRGVRESGLMPISVPEGQDPNFPFGAFAFYVHFSPCEGTESPMGAVDPVISGGFSEVTGLEATMEAKAIKEGGRNYGVHQRPGQVTFATVVLKRGMIESRHLWRWWALWAGADGAQNGGWGTSSRCNVTIALIQEEQAGQGTGASSGERSRRAVIGWRLENAMPVKFRAGDLNARGTEVAIEELHLVHEGLHMNEVG